LQTIMARLYRGNRSILGYVRPASRLRGELTEFVGRRAELVLVRQALSSARLVTLIGPGGIGKTRLAIEAASGARRAFGDGVGLAELGGLRDPALLVPEVARSLGLADKSARWAVASLSDRLAGRRVLLMLDQCEHLADACAVMADALLRACPGLRIVATSRHVLGVAGEVTVVVPPMAVPADGASAPEELLCYEAVRLFADRAAAVRPGFAVDAENGATVAAVCRALDGIPLAIELAAVRLRSLSPQQVLARLDSRFQLLSGGGPADQPHHRTLQAALDWSYGLLTEAEQAMWRRVSVFAGSFDLDAAEAVCAGEGIAARSVMDLVDGLVAKSILSHAAGNPNARYRLLGTIGDFGLQKLRTEGGERPFRARHRDRYAALAARREAFGPRRAEWIADLDTDHENLRAAIEFCMSDPQEVAAGAELACHLWRYWETHGHLTEGRRIMAALLDKLDETATVRPRALWVAGFLALVQGDTARARALLEAALAAARQAGDVRNVAYASSFLGYAMYWLGEEEQGHALAESALDLHQQSGDQVGVVLAQMQIGFLHLCAKDERSAADWFGECARTCESSGNTWYHAYARLGLGVAALLLADHGAADVLVRAALDSMRKLDDPVGVVLCLDALAWTAAAYDQASRALTLLAAADAAWAAIPATPRPDFREHHDAALAAARDAVPESAVAAAVAEGAAMSQAQAIAYALGEPARPKARSGTGPATAHPRELTRRERDVAVLVARGLSNGEIAGELVISPRTVETHVQHIMDKLGVGTRAQIAAWSAAGR
jgi:predicted ATPase/DNA-binding CsgD family transcriptional regulator